MDRRDKRQLHLPGEWTKGVKDIDEYIRRHPDDLTAAADDGRLPSGDLAGSQGQTPADGSKSSDTGEAQSRTVPSGVGPEPQTARSDDARRAFGRGVFPDPVTGNSMRGQPTRIGTTPVFRVSRGNPRDGLSRGNPRNLTGKSP